jgi:hypothetical protein
MYKIINLVEYKNKIKDNKRIECNHSLYSIIQYSKFEWMKRTGLENPFNSEHFVWINICIERMGYKNLIHLDEALTNIRNKFSTCYIDYVSDKLVSDLDEYYKFGRCSMCSGFFTGNKEYFSEFCLKILDKFYPNINIDYTNSPQFTLYEDGHFIAEHNDGENVGRVCALIIYLSYDEDYNDGGGELIVTGNSGKIYTIKPTFGTFSLLDFTKNNAKHAVSEVKNGFKRYAFISFFNKTKIKFI